MIEVLKSDARATSDHGTIAIRRTFAHGNPRDRFAGGFGPLVSIAETYIAPSAGFPMHPHRDMEIVSFMADGAMAHRDTLGNGTIIAEGEVQRMSAGTGIVHSEFNPSDTEPCRFGSCRSAAASIHPTSKRRRRATAASCGWVRAPRTRAR